ncbi:hypothetical protein C3L33_05916, partial [Rhododendron williamsianum]
MLPSNEGRLTLVKRTLSGLPRNFLFDVQVMSVKALGTSLKLSLEGNNQLIYPETWFFMIVVATCVVTQMNYLNKVTVEAALGAVFLPGFDVHDWDGQSGGSIVSNICGFIVVLSGTILLHVTRDFERSSPFKGNYAPLSPSFSAGLCNGNGELSNHEEEDEPCSEEVCLRRQELYP